MLRVIALLLLSLAFFLEGCHEKVNRGNKQLTTVTATLKAVPTQLYYAGTVAPIRIYNVTSPADGVVKSLSFKYGQRVKQGDVLLVLTSTKLQEDFHSALTDYLKAKTAYTNAQINFQGTQELMKAQIISKQEFLSDQDQYQDAVLSYITAKNALEKIVRKIPQINTQQLEQLSESDFAKLQTLLAVQSSDLTITAPQTGVVLSAKSGGGDGGDGSDSGDGAKTLQVGSQIKQDQTLLTIGDLSGIETTVPAGENVINEIKPGQAVTVSLDALPNVTLSGVIKSVGAQAQTSGGEQSGVANFPVIVDVPKIPPNQSEKIRVGMSTKVNITLPNPAEITVPISAVNQTDGTATVTILGPHGKPVVVPVVTGRTTVDEIAIVKGLKPGDQVVLP